jgi:hypothetical protein
VPCVSIAMCSLHTIGNDDRLTKQCYVHHDDIMLYKPVVFLIGRQIMVLLVLSFSKYRVALCSEFCRQCFMFVYTCVIIHLFPVTSLGARLVIVMCSCGRVARTRMSMQMVCGS